MAVALRDHMRLLQASRRDALTDSLTGLGNRRLLMLDLEARIATAGIDAPCTVMLFDLDGFKRYNDWYGHPAGDALLARIGHRLSAATEPAGRAYRLGGDEFCVIFTGGELEALRVRDAAAAALVGEDRGFRLGSSLGAVTVPREAATVTSVLKLADERLYAHKARTQRQPAARAQPNVNA
jgi:diguanylate cyclase (GGDEF)-like protein